jgi:ubiquinone/menaquinone biosynthesis C-methylase UbiE
MRNPRIGFVEYFLRNFTPARGVLIDVGCGSAQYRHTTDARYYGIDLTMDEYKPGVTRDPDILGSAMALPVRDGSVDVVFTVGTFLAFQDHRLALREFHRVLKSGGWVLLFDYNRQVQRKLQYKGGYGALPCWTRDDLRRLIAAHGFQHCQSLVPVARPVGILERTVRLMLSDVMPQWAIVAGVKP